MTIYLDVNRVIQIHDAIEFCPVRDTNALGSAVAKPATGFGSHEQYPTLTEKAAALLQGLAMNHPFMDGNKRTAWTSAQMMLTLNGAPMRLVDPEEAASFVTNVVTEHHDVEHIAIWLTLRLS